MKRSVCFRLVLCIDVIMMQQNNIRSLTPFRVTIGRCGNVYVPSLTNDIHWQITDTVHLPLSVHPTIEQNVTADAKIAIALCFMAHGDTGFTLRVAAKLKTNIAIKYLHEVPALIADKLKGKWMRNGILEQYPTNMENCRARFFDTDFQSLMVGAGIAGTHVP